MTPITPIQQIVGLGRWTKLHCPTIDRVTNATIGWNAALICMQTFQDHARAPVLAACLLHHQSQNDELVDLTTELIGFDPYASLSDLELKIVEFSVTLAELHELSDELKRGNVYIESHLVLRQQELSRLNNEIARLTKEEDAEDPTPAPKPEYKH